MFVQDFKELKKRKTKLFYKKVVMVYEWNQNTEKFNQVEKDLQAEIDKNIGMDLKSMIARNILPSDQRKLIYGDTTILKDVNLGKLYDLSNIELVSENGDTEPKKEESKKDDLKTSEEVKDGK